MTSDDVRATKDNAGICTITLNRPERKNAMLPTMWGELAEALREAERDASVRLVVLRGSGSDFCSGADVKKPTGGSSR